MSYSFQNNEIKVMLQVHYIFINHSCHAENNRGTKTNKRIFINVMLYYERALKRILNSVCLFIFCLERIISVNINTDCFALSGLINLTSRPFDLVS
jgi:hypothetical protein